MPELPEVETMRRGVLPIVGSKITSVERPECKCRPILLKPRIDRFQKRVDGTKIVAIDRLGKRVVIRLSSTEAIVLEPRMTGLVLLADPPSIEHLRFRISLSSKSHRELLFWDRRGLGTVQLLSSAELEILENEKLGPDALSITAQQFADRLGKSQRAVKVALLDQSAVAGIGNLYAAEILHVAGVDPTTCCHRISRSQWQRIADGTSLVLQEAIKYEGSTLSDGTYRNALNESGGYQNHHRVYDCEGSKCSRCGEATIKRIVQAQRSTFFCPKCQRKRGIHPSLGNQ